MAQTAFSVVYDGPALQDGEMPVRELAPALLALGDLFVEASTVLYPDLDPVALNVKATERGSFDVSLILHAEDIWDQIVRFFASTEANALVNLHDAILSASGIFALIRWRKKRRIARQETLTSGQVKIELDDGTTAEWPADVVVLNRRVSIRKKARTVVGPVGRPGVTKLEVRREEEVTLSVGAEDVPAFEPTDEESVALLDQESEAYLSIVSPVFKEGNKWRFNDGQATFSAAIEDPAFIERVNMGEPFASGDMLRCRVRVLQTETEGKLRMERHIVHVIEHVRRERAEQLSLEPPRQD